MAGGKIVFDGAPERLANEADGRVWEMDLQPGEEEQLKKVATVVDQIPREDGTLHSRVLSLAQPRADASPVSPTLEDGYLWLVGAGARA
jgi:ABC-2 type transport system ATP-binding protein